MDAFEKQLPARHRLYLNTPIQRVTRLTSTIGTRDGGGVSMMLGDGTVRVYDHVVLAVHANQAMRLLGDGATPLEGRMLSCFETRRNVCYLHSDTDVRWTTRYFYNPSSVLMLTGPSFKFLPKRSSARVAWNCFLGRAHNTEAEQVKVSNSRISITFDMNKLQGIPVPGKPGSPGQVLVTLNPTKEPRATQSSQVYYHPLLNAKSLQMAERLHELQRDGPEGVIFAGAWMGFGFHEDGFAAGTHAANMVIRGRDKAGQLNLVAGSGTTESKKGTVVMALRIIVLLIQRIILSF